MFLLSSDLLGTVYVDEVSGTNNKSCGISQNPCKDLSEGVKRVEEFGTVKVIGSHYRQHTVVLDRSIVIATDINKDVQRGSIYSNGSVYFAFDLDVNVCYKSFKNEIERT